MAVLYCNATEHTIEDDQGASISVEKARDLLVAEKVENCNLAFQRLASYEFDWDRLDQFYQDNP